MLFLPKMVMFFLVLFVDRFVCLAIMSINYFLYVVCFGKETID